MQKAKRDDFRIEEELRTNRAKYEESNEDILRRMQDIKDAEADSIRDLTGFMDCQLSYHERCADELRRVKRTWPGAATAASGGSGGFGGGGGSSLSAGGYGGRSRSNTARSYNSDRFGNSSRPEEEPESTPVRMSIRSNSRVPSSGNLGGLNNSISYAAMPDKPPRPSPAIRSNTFQGGGGVNASTATAAAVSSLRNGLRPVGRTQTGSSYNSTSSNGSVSVYVDEPEDSAGGGGGYNGGGNGNGYGGGRSGSPEWAAGDRSASPATSYDSLSRSSSNLVARKPPPPPPMRSKKPAPPPPMKREVGY